VRIAVVIPLFNGAAWIADTLRSVRAQELAASEVVVVDDGSTDGSADIVRGFEGVHLLKNPRKGSVVARNFGLARTDAPVVAFLDQDDLWHAGHLRGLAGALECHPEAPAAASAGVRYWGIPPQLSATATTTQRLDDWETFPFVSRLQYGPSALLLRRAQLAAVGGWDERHTGMADWHLWLKLCTLAPFVQTDGRTVAKRQHPDSQGRRVRADPSAYFRFRYDVLKDALEYRQSTPRAAEDSAVFTRRLAALAQLRNIADAMMTAAKPRRIARPARDIERALRDFPAEHLRLAFLLLISVLSPTYDTPDHHGPRGEPLRELLDEWPVDAPRTRAALAAVVAELES
jgi:hypothetical protein